jgi:hypothetical protein
MRPLFVLAFFLAGSSCFAQTAPPAAAQAMPGTDEILAQEQLLWKLYASGDLDGLDKLILPDFTSISRKKISNRDEILAATKQNQAKCSVEPVVIKHPLINVLSPDAATIVYVATIKRTCDNLKGKSESNMSTVWVRRDGVWKAHLHSELITSSFAVQAH